MSEVTLAIVTRNRFKGIIETLGQLKLEPFENVLIIDDSDHTKLEKWSEGKPIIHYRGPGKNMQAARNLAISKCDTDIISFIDDDILLPSNYCERVKSSFSDSGAVAVGGPCLHPDPSEAAKLCIKNKMVITAFGNIYDSAAFWIPDKKRAVDTLRGANMSFKLSDLESIGGFDEQYGGYSHREETDVFYRISDRGSIIYDPELVGLHKVSKTHSKEIISHKFHNHGRFVAKNFGVYMVVFSFLTLFTRLCGEPESVYQLVYRKFVLNQDVSISSCVLNLFTGGME